MSRRTMLFLAHCTSRKARVDRRATKRPGRRLRFEPLEDRRVLATITVTSLNDAAVTGPNRRRAHCGKQFMTPMRCPTLT